MDGLAPLVRRSMFGRVFETRERDGTVRNSFFDPYGRPYLEGETPPGGSFVWRTWTYRDALGDPIGTIELAPASLAASGLATNCWSSLWGSGAWKGLLTERAFDRRGNLVVSWDPAGNETYHERDSIGRLVGSFGATHPVSRTLDSAGRLIALGTTRDGSAWDVTGWDYDRATGLCTNKTYADGSRVVRSFTPDGLPLRTDFASGRWTQNAYDAARRLSSVTTSDGEVDAAYVRDAFGRIVQATDPNGRTVLSLDPLGRPASETRLAGRGYSTVLSLLERPRDAFGRPAGLRLEFEGDFRQSVCYTWGMDGRLSGMILSNAQDRAVEVFFDWDRGRLAGWEVEGLGSCLAEFRQRFERYDRRPALVKTAVAGPPGRIPPPSTRSFSYVRDLFGRPVSRNADSFAHDALGQVTNAVLGGASYRYAYDGIGNRTTATEAGAQTDYFANALNQYTNLVAGSPPSGTVLSHDADGNLTDDGARTFEWTASGRLLRAATDSARVTSEYDHLGRRTARTVETRHARRWNFADEREFVYDDWNLVHEKRILHATGQIVRLDYFWGPDLSGTLQGAGGVGGLVAVSVDGDYYFPGYDDNGNVVGYWDEAGDLVAEYAYDAFGNTISATGPMADVFPHRFSTKYYDAETDLYYYGYRYYSPSLGRWISRDPIEEEGGVNLYSFVCNNPSALTDALGECVSVVLLGDSLMHGTYSQGRVYDGLKDHLSISDECNYRESVGKGGLRINEIHEKYLKSPHMCGNKVVVIALMGMNDVLHEMDRQYFSEVHTDDALKTAFDSRLETVCSKVSREWEKLLNSVRCINQFIETFNDQSSNNHLFIHVFIPRLLDTHQMNKRYRGARWITYYNTTIDRLNVVMGFSASSQLKPHGWNTTSFLSDYFMSHHGNDSTDGIDDGVHFFSSEYEKLGAGISQFINNYNWNRK